MTGRNLFLWLTCLALGTSASQGQTPPSPTNPKTVAAASSSDQQSLVLEATGKVEVTRVGSKDWAPVTPNQRLNPGDRVRTGERSRASLRLPNLSVLRINERTVVEIQRTATASSKATLNIQEGAAYFLGRGRPGEIDVRTPMASGAIRGTEFHVQVDGSGASVFTLVEGAMEVMNEVGSASLKPGEQATVQRGAKPQVRPALQMANLIQWSLYYPAVLDVSELEFDTSEANILATSLAAYRAGDLEGALTGLPTAPVQSSAAGIYEAAVLLSVGQVDQAEARLSTLKEPKTKSRATIEALTLLISTVKNERPPTARETNAPLATSPSLLLAQSYWYQSGFQLERAFELAANAVRLSPNFGFAWERLAELHFSFGRVAEAQEALVKALEFSPRNAQAWALKGFLLSAQRRMAPALEAFEQAVSLDASLGNAWLGRGLVRIRRGDLKAGLEDLQTAVTLEPNRALLRSYLGKAFDAANDPKHAANELRIARELDPSDPTGWLYSALLSYDQHRINQAVEELERSMGLNEGRRLYRSRFLLDQDKAVSSVNLANVYLSAGLNDVSVHEASRAVAYDYSNPSSHRFLADSFNALRDPTRFNLRHETVWFNETLLSDLLSPVGADSLSQHVSQYEYSKLFERDRFGLNSSTTARSDGQYQEFVSQFGTFGGTSYSLDLEYQYNKGVRPNNELSRIEWYSKFKQQLSEHDSLFLLTKYQDYESGDNFQYYDPAKSRPGFSYKEFQSPYVVGAYHREWAPGMHTLLLAGGFENDQKFADSSVPIPLLERNASGQISRLRTPTFDVDYGSVFAFYHVEVNQILQFPADTVVAGVRYQVGDFENQNKLTVPTGSPFSLLFPNPATDASFTDDFEHAAGYAYWTHTFWEQLYLTAGASYDQLRFPANHRAVPISGGESNEHQLSPKASLIWMPNDWFSVRGMYSQFLGGVSFDESYRLEPTQLAGFGQAYRNIISESVVGSVSGPRYEVAGAGVDFKFKTRTYAGFQTELLRSEVDGSVGAFTLPLPIRPTSLERTLSYEERAASVYAQQLLGDHWSVGSTYTLRDSALNTLYPQIPLAVNAAADKEERATMHQINANLMFNHSSGFYSRLDSNWTLQSNRGYSPDMPSDSVHQLDFSVGYRFPRKIGSIQLTVANLTDQDYRLNPLNLYNEMPRERVFLARLRLHF